MPNCPSCNIANSATASFCSACGAALDGDAPNPYAGDPPAVEPDEQTTGDDAFDSQLLELAREGKKIAAIKLYREQSGCGLKEAKDYVESLARQHGVVSPAGGCAGILMLTLASIIVVTTILSNGFRL